MDRLVVVGGPGSGKTTLAMEAAAALSATHVELDSIWWQNGWKALEVPEFAIQVSDVLDRSPKWVVDGNYVEEVSAVVWPQADVVVWLDVRRWTGVRRAVLRSARRSVTRQELWNGNRQGFEVLSPQSIVRLWSRWPSYGDRIRRALEVTARPDLPVARLQSPKDVRAWLDGLGIAEPQRRSSRAVPPSMEARGIHRRRPRDVIGGHSRASPSSR